MDLKKILHDLADCPCGRKHTLVTKIVEISSGATQRTGALLDSAGFPKKVLLVADDNTLSASAGLLDSLSAAGYEMKKLIYPDGEIRPGGTGQRASARALISTALFR